MSIDEPVRALGGYLGGYPGHDRHWAAALADSGTREKSRRDKLTKQRLDRQIQIAASFW